MAHAEQSTGPVAFLERQHELELLTGLLGGADGTAHQPEGTGGRVVLVRGDAGIGKTALIAHFIERVGTQAHVLMGGCDDLLTPQPLGPFWDVARDHAFLTGPLRSGDLRALMESLLARLRSGVGRPSVLVLEDMQWADEATLDVVTFLGRRIGRATGIIVLTYRDGEVDPDHPLRQVIGNLPPQVLVRIPLLPLSSDAVAAMVADKAFDVEAVVALTGGNPLFVTEVVASGVEAVPASVREAVLSRAARLTPTAGRTLRLVSIIPGGTEHSLLDAVVDGATDSLRECAKLGLLRNVGDHVSFPHELQRRAVESSLSDHVRRELNRSVMAALDADGDPARLVHHAREAGDVAAIVAHGPRAARAAMAMGSHREAVAHFRSLEPHLARFDPTERAELLEDWARAESYLDSPGATDLVDRAISLRRSLGDTVALARVLTFAVRTYEVNGRPEQADACANEASTMLAAERPGAPLAAALAQQAWLRLMRGDDDRGGVEIADRAAAIAESVGDDRTVAQALILKGAIEHSSDGHDGFAMVEEGHRRAVLGEHRFEEVYALINLAGLCGDDRDLARAADLARRAREAAARYEFRSLEAYAQAVYAEVLLWQGDWVGAEDAATSVFGSHPHAEMIAWRILGILQARRGRPAAVTTLERVWELAAASDELQNIDPAASAVAEWMWLAGDRDPDRIGRLNEVASRGRRSGYTWPSGALVFWMWQLGLVATPPEGGPALYRRIMQGEIAAAADFWAVRGAPYDRALALMHGDRAARIEAVHLMDDLGAVAAADRIRDTLAADGVRVPRGRSRATREHAAGLTARQAEVLVLLADGLSNGDIADRLFVSPRTVENHVAAVLMKLDVPTRQAAADAAHDRGLLPRR